MWLTFAVLTGILVNPARPAFLVTPSGANILTLPQAAAEKDTKVPDEKLIAAIDAGDVEKTRALLKSGADANGSDLSGESFLKRAVMRDNTTIARILIEAGANVNQPGSFFPVPPGTDSSPLTLAVTMDHVEMARLLLSLGAKVDGAGPGQGPPLEIAAQWGHVEMARLLLSFGAKVNGSGPGKSPLAMALSGNYLEMAKILIDAGADVNAEKAYAESHQMTDIVKRLEKVQRPAPPPMTAEQVVSFLGDQFGPLGWRELRENSDPPTDADMNSVVSELRARLKAKPQDMQALLLWAHFGLMPEPLQLPAEAQPPASEPESLPTPAVALDRVLAAQPHNAEALFLKGRITVASDRGKALVLLRQALELAPSNPRYGAFLAQVLAAQGRPGEAAQILRSLQKSHPVIPFLEDLETLGVPEGGEPVYDGTINHTSSPPDSDDDAGMYVFTMATFLSNARLEDPWHVRLRIYHYAKSPAEIEAFYASRIPGFRFIEEKEKEQGEPASGDQGAGHTTSLFISSLAA